MNEVECNRKYFQIAGISIEVNSDLPLGGETFASKFDFFEVDGSLEDNVVISHHFLSSVEQGKLDLSNRLYFRPPWAIYQLDDGWIYQWIKPEPPHESYCQTVIADKEHAHLDIYNDAAMKKKFLQGGLNSLTLFPTDQILLGRLLAHRAGCIIHSVGMIIASSGYLFVGHSDAGKSTVALMMKKEALILCDDRNVIRQINGQFKVSGTWSHGDVTDVSSMTAPLNGIFFLRQADRNHVECINDVNTCFESLLACLIRPLETREWWEKSIDLLLSISQEVPCWRLEFDKSGKIVDLVKKIANTY